MAQRHYVRTSATRYRCGDNRTNVKTFVMSASSPYTDTLEGTIAQRRTRKVGGAGGPAGAVRGRGRGRARVRCGAVGRRGSGDGRGRGEGVKG